LKYKSPERTQTKQIWTQIISEFSRSDPAPIGTGRVPSFGTRKQDFKYKELTEKIIKIFHRVYLRISARRLAGGFAN